jgi:hypothetical protein
MALVLAVFAQHDFRNADRLAAMTAKHTAKMRRQFNRHERLLLREFGQALKNGGYKWPENLSIAKIAKG